MHTAAIYAAQEDDARFFNILLTLRFPLYEEDIEGDFAPFIIAGIKGDGVFLEAFKALLKAKFDLAQRNSNRVTFIECLCQSKHMTTAKMQALLQTNP